MILLDPDLDPDPAPKSKPAKPLGASIPVTASKSASRDVRLPSARTLAKFLSSAQQAVRLKGQVTVLLTTDAAIRKLNHQFRGKNKATDVLSFPAEGLGAQSIAGDLAISVTTAMGQAAEQGHSLSTEIKVLVLHGLLHLAGYDHEIDNGKMARRERLLRAKLNLPQGLIERAGADAKTPKAKTPKESAPAKKDWVPQVSILRPGKPQTKAAPRVLKGHGFSRATKAATKITALAAEGMQVARKASPQGLKPKSPPGPQTARLKSIPSKTSPKPKPTGKASRP
jgi:probable rRNA maturation factor